MNHEAENDGCNILREVNQISTPIEANKWEKVNNVWSELGTAIITVNSIFVQERMSSPDDPLLFRLLSLAMDLYCTLISFFLSMIMSSPEDIDTFMWFTYSPCHWLGVRVLSRARLVRLSWGCVLLFSCWNPFIRFSYSLLSLNPSDILTRRVTLSRQKRKRMRGSLVGKKEKNEDEEPKWEEAFSPSHQCLFVSCCSNPSLLFLLLTL